MYSRTREIRLIHRLTMYLEEHLVTKQETKPTTRAAQFSIKAHPAVMATRPPSNPLTVSGMSLTPLLNMKSYTTVTDEAAAMASNVLTTECTL